MSNNIINYDIKYKLEKYQISRIELLKYLTNFKTPNRVSEELARPLSFTRRQEYFDAIEKIRKDKIKNLMED